MIYTFQLTRNDKPIGVLDLEGWLGRYFATEFSHFTMKGICRDDTMMKEIERVMPHCGYDIHFLEVE